MCRPINRHPSLNLSLNLNLNFQVVLDIRLHRQSASTSSAPRVSGSSAHSSHSSLPSPMRKTPRTTLHLASNLSNHHPSNLPVTTQASRLNGL